MNLINNLITKARNWWANNRQNIGSGAQAFFDKSSEIFDRVVKNIARLIFIGFIINIVVAYFYPEFPQKFPVIYGWFDGWLQFGEFLLKAALSGIYSLFTGNWPEFWAEYTNTFDQLLQQFLSWIASLHF